LDIATAVRRCVMKTRRIVLVGTVAMTALAATGFGTSGVTPLGLKGRATVVPPASYVGSSRPDNLRGSDANDVLRGLAGNDRLRGGRGNDVLRGGAGQDRLFGGLGRDALYGERGNDRLSARDGERDLVAGGPGFDQAWVDQNDVAQGVERVYRKNVSDK
jgi:Ca2+-binding RTX toxin-like protein